MLRAATLTIGVALAAPGCLWEPIQQAPAPGNGDAALVIQAAAPSSNQLFLGFENDRCAAQVGLPSVFSPRAAPLKASFFLNFDPPNNNVEPLSINGQTQFALQVGGDPHTYSLASQLIHIDDFVTQLNGQANVLQVFVGDDLDDCPYPSSLSQTVPVAPGNQTLNCYTTSWTWVVEPSSCSVLEGF